MKVTTIKQYSNTYYTSFFYRAQFGSPEAKIAKDIKHIATNDAHDLFVEDTNRYRSIPTPKFEECRFEIQSVKFTEDKNSYRHYNVKVRVVWQYEKEPTNV